MDASDIGRSLAGLAEVMGLRAAIRAHYAKRFGTCRVCEAPLGGPSPEQVCEDCPAGEALAMALGGSDGGDA